MRVRNHAPTVSSNLSSLACHTKRHQPHAPEDAAAKASPSQAATALTSETGSANAKTTFKPPTSSMETDVRTEPALTLSGGGGSAEGVRGSASAVSMALRTEAGSAVLDKMPARASAKDANSSTVPSSRAMLTHSMLGGKPKNKVWRTFEMCGLRFRVPRFGIFLSFFSQMCMIFVYIDARASAPARCQLTALTANNLARSSAAGNGAARSAATTSSALIPAKS